MRILFQITVISLVTLCILFIFKREYRCEKPVKISAIQQFTPIYSTVLPNKADRTIDVTKWLESSYKITLEGGAHGSGTLCYYDYKNKIGYVISAGHLWGRGNSNRQKSANIIVYYHNELKLSVPESYPANVIFSSTDLSHDCSLLTFKPNWIPYVYYPVSEIYNVSKNIPLHSVGCDLQTELSHYTVISLGRGRDPLDGISLITYKNNPRPGRSGGGLFNDHGFLMGICWGTSPVQGGRGYFTTIDAIHELILKNNCNFILNQSKPSPAQYIPIEDSNGRRTYSPNYILLP
jgi:hypothetical protein